MSEHKPEPASEHAHAAGTADGAASMPVLKRILIGISALPLPLVVISIAIAIVLSVMTFAGGLLLGVHKGHATEQILQIQVKNKTADVIRLTEEKEALEKQLSDVKTLSEAQQTDLKIARDTASRLQLENDALEKVVADVKDKLTGALPAKVAEKPQGYKLKFSDKDCDPNNRTVTSKSDVGCMNLKDAIQQMNSASDAKKTGPGTPVKH